MAAKQVKSDAWYKKNYGLSKKQYLAILESRRGLNKAWAELRKQGRAGPEALGAIMTKKAKKSALTGKVCATRGCTTKIKKSSKPGRPRKYCRRCKPN